MGLAAAYPAVLDGHGMDVLEANAEVGGMAGHFDFDGISIARFYRFVCRADRPIFHRLRSVLHAGIQSKVRWTDEVMIDDAFDCLTKLNAQLVGRI